ncbi:MAG: Modification methylase BanI [bacterium]|nr:Modification methylase BanI [bacterium]
MNCLRRKPNPDVQANGQDFVTALRSGILHRNRMWVELFMTRSDTPYQFVSLFSGCGGFDLGLVDAGFVPVQAYDSCADAICHYQRNVCSKAVQADLTEFMPQIDRTPDIVIAGPPCQGFSTAGKRDLADERNHLLPLAGRIAAHINPRVIVIENVTAAASGAHLKYWKEMEEHLRSKDYRTHTLKANAADIGLSQTRRRLLLFAWRTARDIDFQIHAKPSRRLDVTLSGVEKLPNHDPEPLAVDSRDYRIACRIGPGQKLSNVRGGSRSIHTWNIPEVFGKTTAAECQMLEFIMRVRRQERRRTFGDADPVSVARLKKQFKEQTTPLIQALLHKGYLRRVGTDLDLCHSFNGKYRRFQWDDKACTVDTRFGEAQLFLHPNEHRPFTVREAARIQGFPDDYVFDCTKRTAFRLIGNAVPPPMGRMVAGFARELLGR